MLASPVTAINMIARIVCQVYCCRMLTKCFQYFTGMRRRRVYPLLISPLLRSEKPGAQVRLCLWDATWAGEGLGRSTEHFQLTTSWLSNPIRSPRLPAPQAKNLSPPLRAG
jgi:hypothetical protein